MRIGRCLTGCVVFTALAAGGMPAAASVSAVNMAGPRQVTWEADGVTATLYQVEATPDLTSTWKVVGQVIPTGSLHSIRFNTTNEVLHYRMWAVTSVFPRTRHEMVLVPGGAYRMGGDRSNWYHQGSTIPAFAQELPAHDVTVSSFLMDRYEVDNEKVAEVFQWAYSNALIALLPVVFTQGMTVITNNNAWIVNTEGTTQTLGYTDRSWDEIRFTNGQFTVNGGRHKFPSLGLTWYGALAYANFRSDMEGLARAVNFTTAPWTMTLTNGGYRLPTEAEWEKACRGGQTNTLFPWPNDSQQGTNNYLYNIDVVKANYWDYRYPAYSQPRHPWFTNAIKTTPVGYYNGQQLIDFGTNTLAPFSGADAGKTQDMANAYGIYDMAGNVYEWCWDYYRANWYSMPGATGADTMGETNAQPNRVLRGGSWASDFLYPLTTGSSGDPSYLRCAYRFGQDPSSGYFTIGFRLVRSIR